MSLNHEGSRTSPLPVVLRIHHTADVPAPKTVLAAPKPVWRKAAPHGITMIVVAPLLTLAVWTGWYLAGQSPEASLMPSTAPKPEGVAAQEGVARTIPAILGARPEMEETSAAPADAPILPPRMTPPQTAERETRITRTSATLAENSDAEDSRSVVPAAQLPAVQAKPAPRRRPEARFPGEAQKSRRVAIDSVEAIHE